MSIDEKISKSQIDNIGKRLQSTENIQESDLRILNNFRFQYRDLIQSAEKHFSTIKNIDFTSSVRLKRTPSIVIKLKRFANMGKSMRLSSMQDIGGCRFIFNNLSDLNTYVEWMENNLGNYLIKKKDNFTVLNGISKVNSVFLSIRI